MHISDVLFTGVIYGSRVNTVLFFISISCELVNKVYINVCVCVKTPKMSTGFLKFYN